MHGFLHLKSTLDLNIIENLDTELEIIGNKVAIFSKKKNLLPVFFTVDLSCSGQMKKM